MKPALLLVDLQHDYLSTLMLPPADALVARTTAILEQARRLKLPIVHIWTTVRREDDRRLPHWREAQRWMCVDGAEGHQPPDPLRPLPGETIIHKTGFNPFANGKDGGLHAALQNLNCDSVLLAGLHLHACVRTAAVECLERGYRVFVAEDAVASNDPAHAASTRRWLRDRSVVFEPGAAILSRLNGQNAPARIVHRSPRLTREVLFEAAIAGPREIVAAVAGAQGAWTDWRRTSMASRQELFARAAARLEESAMTLARQMAIEVGKPRTHGLEEVQRTAANIRDAIRRATEPLQRREAAGLVRYEPLGVVALVSPWNNPVAIPLGKIAPALLYGNTVVWKPAPAATQIAIAILELLNQAGLPKGAVQLLIGDHTTAQGIAADERIDAVTFTGSLAGGYAMQEICGRRLIPLQAELSGNNAAIVWDDTDFPEAAAAVARGAFAFAGQRCTANRRVIVPRSAFDKFLEELQTAAGQLVWGDPLNPETEIGPVIHASKRDEIAALVAAAEAEGHRVLRLHPDAAGQSWVRDGAYAQPVIVCCDRARHPLVQEESMAPLLIVQPAKDFEHALELCNGVRHGLAAALFSRSPERQRRFLQEARAGVLKLNAATSGVDVTLPFGGWKASALGPPEHGEGDRLFYTRTQAVYGMEK